MNPTQWDQLIREQVQVWLDKNQGRMNRITAAIAAAVAPTLTEEIKRSILVRVGTVTPDERQVIAELLHDCALALSMYPVEPHARRVEAEKLVTQVRSTIDQLERQGVKPPPKPTEEIPF